MSKPFSIYVHFPFCISKCRYCAFASEAIRGHAAPRLVSHYLQELDHYRDMLAGREVSSVYFGGGTPSLMPISDIGAILERIAGNWQIAYNAEITLEANPATITRGKMRGLLRAGVNRISLGIQSFNDAELGFLGRAHDAKTAREAIGDAEAIFSNYSCDFIYGLPGQSAAKWGRTLAELKHAGIPHLSLYQLAIERGTALYRAGAGEADEATALAMLDMNARTFRQYEVSNYAAPGLESRHNLNYWRGGDYLGIGAAAAGRLSLGGKYYATQNPRTAAAWIMGLAEGSGPKLRRLWRTERAREMVITGLRMTEGIDIMQFKQNSGLDFSETAKPHKELAIKNGRAKLSQRGIRLLDSVLAQIL